MTYCGSWKIDDLLTFYLNTQVFATGVATDADSAPAYRVYEDETGTPILTGTMALLDSANTAGFYSEQITLSAANGFERGKCYAIYISATVSGVSGATHRTFQIGAEVNVPALSDTAIAEPAGAPAASATLSTKISFLYEVIRNKLTVTSTAITFFNDAGSAQWSKALSDDATTYTEAEGS